MWLCDTTYCWNNNKVTKHYTCFVRNFAGSPPKEQVYKHTPQKPNIYSLYIWLHRQNLFVNLWFEMACDWI